MSKHWTPEQRKRQSELIQRWKPWEKSTGPKSKDGKRTSAMRGLKTGEHTAEMRELRKMLAKNNQLLRSLMARGGKELG